MDGVDYRLIDYLLSGGMDSGVGIYNRLLVIKHAYWQDRKKEFFLLILNQRKLLKILSFLLDTLDN